MTSTALYRCRDAEGTLLYVGITGDAARRFTEHAHRQTWWRAVTAVTIEWHGSRPAALAAEREALRLESPRFNQAEATRHGHRRWSVRVLADKLLDSRLDEFLAERRSEGASYNDIAADLEARIDYRVTGETIRVWCQDLDVPSDHDGEVVAS